VKRLKHTNGQKGKTQMKIKLDVCFIYRKVQIKGIIPM
jgi:hypothetical protein